MARIAIITLILLCMLTPIKLEAALTYDNYIELEASKYISTDVSENLNNPHFATCTYLKNRVTGDVYAYNDLEDNLTIGLYNITNTCQDDLTTVTANTLLYISNEYTHIVTFNNIYIYAKDFNFDTTNTTNLVSDSNLKVLTSTGEDITSTSYQGYEYDEDTKILKILVADTFINVKNISGEIEGPTLLETYTREPKLSGYHSKDNEVLSVQDFPSEYGIYESKIISNNPTTQAKDIVLLYNDYSYFTNHESIIHRMTNYSTTEELQAYYTLPTYDVDKNTTKDKTYQLIINNNTYQNPKQNIISDNPQNSYIKTQEIQNSSHFELYLIIFITMSGLILIIKS